jgi:hypothetical protein
MLGWDIYATCLDANKKKINIASWSTGLGGCRWLDDLVKQGLAKDLGGNGYPNTYELTLDTLLDRIIPSPPSDDAPLVISDDVSDDNNKSFKVNLDLIMDLDSKTVVTVEAWDQS